jgi:hypothetical protein
MYHNTPEITLNMREYLGEFKELASLLRVVGVKINWT